MSETFVTSDSHLFHEKIIKYSNRPFKNRHEMNEALIKNWNDMVAPTDTVYHLGDVAVGVQPGDKLGDALYALNGTIYLIRGNHEKAAERYEKRFAWIKDYYEAKMYKQLFVLIHYALRVWNKSHHGSIHLYGHSHGSLPDDPQARSLDIGVDCWNYKPVTIEQINDAIAKKNWKPIDHHGKKENE
jgi:calcineurin-like phosphoesterase family protein